MKKRAFGYSNAIDGKRRATSLDGLDWCNTQLWSHLLFGVHLLLTESTLPIQRPQCVRNANVDFLRTGRQMSPRFSLCLSIWHYFFFQLCTSRLPHCYDIPDSVAHFVWFVIGLYCIFYDGSCCIIFILEPIENAGISRPPHTRHTTDD